MSSELSKYEQQLAVLVGFVEGRLEGAALDEALATEEMKSLLGIFEEARYPGLTNHRLQLDKQDRRTLGGLVNSEGIIEDFLKKADVPFRPAQRFGGLYSLIIASIPEYIDPTMELITEKVVPTDPDLSDAQIKKVIKERLKHYFKCVGKPPKWIQSPDWPTREGRPLVFVGQLPINAPDLFHDTGAAYVFYDPAQGGFETVAQFY